MVNITLAWIHEYGLIAVAVGMSLLLGYGFYQKTRGQGSSLSGSSLALGALVVLLGIAPVLLLEWHLKDHMGRAGTPVVPTPGEVVALLKFWTAGPVPGHAENFVPGTSLAPLLVVREHYIGPAVGVIGIGVLLGLIRESKRARSGPRAGGFALALIAAPVVLTYVFSTLTNTAIWLDRGFVGCGELIILICGVGISGLSRPW